MNAPPPALVEAFLARILRAIDDARALPPDRVLAARAGVGSRGAALALMMHTWATSPAEVRPEIIAEIGGRLGFPLGAGGDEILALVPSDGPWPSDLPLPLTAAEALDIVTRAAPAMAAELAAEVARLAGAMVDPAALDRVLDVSGRGADLVSGWPFPRFGVAFGGPVDSAWLAIERLDLHTHARTLADVVGGAFTLGGGPVGVVRRRWPAVADRLDVSRWVRDGAERGRIPRVEWWPGDDAVGPGSWWVDGGRYPGIGLALLYLAERAELPRVRATVAARLAFASVRALAGARDPGPLHFAALEVVLGENGADDLARLALADGATRARFAAELVTEARTVTERAFLGDAPEAETDARALAGDVAERFAVVLDGLDAGRAADVRAAAAERAEAVRLGREPGFLWIRWFNQDDPEAPPGWLEMLAEALWFGRWRPALARAARPVALSRAFVTSIDVALSARGIDVGADGRPVVVNARGEGIAGWRPAGAVATALEANMLETLARAGLPELARVAAVRFIPWFAHRVQRRPPWLDREPVVFLGGAGQEGGALGALAAELGLRPDRDGAAVLAMLRAFGALVLDYPGGGVSSLLSLDYHPGGPGRGRVSRLEITPGRPWFGHDPALPDGAEHRALVPLPELPGHLPHFRSSANDKAGCARLYLHILAELAMQSDDIARGLGAHIPELRLVEWALRLDSIRPPPLLAPVVLADLERGDVLVKVGPDRWHIAERFPAERALLEAGGRARIGAAVGGKLASESRQEARERLADGKGKGRSGKGRR